MFDTAIHGTTQSGLIDIDTHKVYCLCDASVAEEIIGLFKTVESFTNMLLKDQQLTREIREDLDDILNGIKE